MKIYTYLIKSCIVLVLVLAYGCNTSSDSPTSENDRSFKFVFMTDIHLQPENQAVEGFNQAIDSVNIINPDFVITGGDLVMDVLGQSYERSDTLYNLYQKSLERFNMPVYNTMGYPTVHNSVPKHPSPNHHL